MKATELTAAQLDGLRMSYNYEVNDSTAYVDGNDISDMVLFTYYSGTDFTSDDFTSNPETNDKVNH